jgi:hypothetical protein
MALSEIAQFRQLQEKQENAAVQGLHGLASGFSRHAFIEARAERGAAYILQLLEEGKVEEAHILMQSNTWGLEELEKGRSCHTMTLL